MNDNQTNLNILWITLHRLKVMLTEYHDILSNIELLHSERLDINVCVECFQPWPCKTIDAIDAIGASNE